MKRKCLASLIILAVLVTTWGPVSVLAAETLKAGQDTSSGSVQRDEDNRITISDIVLAARAFTGQAELTAEQMQSLGLDTDGRITLSDVLGLVRKFVAQQNSPQEPVPSPAPSEPTPAPSPAATSTPTSSEQEGQSLTMQIQIGNAVFAATLADTEAAREFASLMQDGPVSIRMKDYSGFEKVGPLGQSLTASNTRITARPGDIMLYNGSQIVLFYGENTWEYTPIGRVDDLEGWDEALGTGSIEAVFRLQEA